MTRKTLLTLGLLAVFMLSACAPTSSAPPPATVSEGEPAAAAPMQEEEAPDAASAATKVPAQPDAAAVEDPMAVPTSRGSQLVATDPNSVNLTSGEPQLIEFFAFW